ncbi:hypothetical protein [Streptomyces sp. NPDC088180]|uniref:hypothetical protein n=1 Tax=Streptomyces sp. NPDC088180 TaxID=3365837 RepID=UPI00380BF0E9
MQFRSEEIVAWARTHDRPVAWVRAGSHHQAELRRPLGYLSAVGPVLAHPVAPAAGLTAADLDVMREWAREMAGAGADPGGATPTASTPGAGRAASAGARNRPRTGSSHAATSCGSSAPTAAAA